MNLLFFDTETTGIPRNYKAPASDVRNWPRLVQIAWLLTDASGRELAAREHIVRPEGFVIPAEAARIHGIDTDRARREGEDLAAVLDAFGADLARAQLLVAHNVAFDEKIVGAELLRAGRVNAVESVTRLCTMQSATEYCRLPGNYGYKWPTLSELHGRLFGEAFSDAHRALADVRACARCCFRLRDLGIVAW